MYFQVLLYVLPLVLPYFYIGFVPFSTHYYYKFITIYATVCFNIHFQWNKYIFVSFSTLYHALPWSFLKKKYINIFFKKLMVTPGNVLIIVTNKNGAKFICKMLVAQVLAHTWPALPVIVFSGLEQHWAKGKREILSNFEQGQHFFRICSWKYIKPK